MILRPAAEARPKARVELLRHGLVLGHRLGATGPDRNRRRRPDRRARTHVDPITGHRDQGTCGQRLIVHPCNREDAVVLGGRAQGPSELPHQLDLAAGRVHFDHEPITSLGRTVARTLDEAQRPDVQRTVDQDMRDPVAGHGLRPTTGDAPFIGRRLPGSGGSNQGMPNSGAGEHQQPSHTNDSEGRSFHEPTIGSLAGVHGNRTHRSRCSRNPTGFEGRAAHQHRSTPVRGRKRVLPRTRARKKPAGHARFEPGGNPPRPAAQAGLALAARILALKPARKRNAVRSQVKVCRE